MLVSISDYRVSIMLTRSKRVKGMGMKLLEVAKNCPAKMSWHLSVARSDEHTQRNSFEAKGCTTYSCLIDLGYATITHDSGLLLLQHLLRLLDDFLNNLLNDLALTLVQVIILFALPFVVILWDLVSCCCIES